jgi:hypothetical protein
LSGDIITIDTISSKSLALYASIYSVSIGAASRSRLIFGLAILGSIFFASLFGLAAGYAFSYADYRWLTIGYLAVISCIHGAERWNRHLFEKKPFFQFMRKENIKM